MLAFTTSTIRAAASATESPSGRATCDAIAASAAATSIRSAPPSRKSRSSQPSTTSASVTVGRVPPAPYAAGPGSAPALCGPTFSAPPGSTQAIEPPPALTSARSITGTRIGWPVPCIQRLAFPPPPTSYSAVSAISPPTITLAFAVVPPMSKLIRFGRPSCRPARAAAITPAAGPDSTTIAGMRRAWVTSRTPPEEPMTCSFGNPNPVVASSSRRR